jgi:plastocyanin domain-containing protein
MKRNAVLVMSLLVAVGLVLSAVGARAQGGKGGEKKVQVVKLSFDDKGYVVTPSKVTKGVPVRMDVDLQTVKGCMRTVVIGDFNVKKTVKDGDQTIAFTPTKAGEIGIICGMNMGKGSFTVAQAGVR